MNHDADSSAGRATGGPRASSVEVHVGDARDVLATLKADSFDVVITDPPYGIAVDRNHPGPRWDRSRVAFDPELWRSVSRVVRPGGSLVAFGHSRTWARLAVALEDAGWTIVDTLAWIHGQGYAAGSRKLDDELTRLGRIDIAAQYEGWGTQLRPAFEPIILARNLRPRQSLAEAIRDGGTGGLHLDATRVDAGDEDRARVPGRVAGPVVWRIARPERRQSQPHPGGRMPSNVLLAHDPECTSEACTRACPVEQVRLDGLAKRGRGEDARRFYQVLHHPKAPPSERPRAGARVGAAVKPRGVMEWLIDLVCHPGDRVLDPFAGTGTTLEVCLERGIDAVGIERDSDVAALIKERLRRGQGG